MKVPHWFHRLAAVLVAAVTAVLVVAVPSASASPPGADHRPPYLDSIESRYAETDLATFHYTVTGSGSPVVLIAGGGLWQYSWRDVIPELARRHTVYAVEMPSQGYTELRRKDFAFDLPAMSAAIGSFLDAVGLERTALVGHSWGGAWSLYFAEQHPERVTKLALLDSPGLNAEKAPTTAIFTAPALGELAMALSTREVYTQGIRSTFHHKELVTDVMMNELWPPFTRPDNRDGFLALWRNLDFRLTDAALGQVTAPTLVLWGEQDEVLPSSQAHGLAARIPNATATILPGCGHTVHEDCPATAIPPLTNFLTPVA
ncbi:alpha/beta fold hydrolase [Nocardia mexicana]|uniref:4,5:9,10-diseco-3-hydroxy-5,9, 17-trioxoandrosta-1(10),2-diene-4-oate hydrolase n=1 Tax=Nocardia mexicana TaxID=279262 RepID=A0A370HDY1_9NOCA|nr:alpha/beta fold hydrolase [Nocardia mexicana]RDI53083.1 4,5:9,10-diseco-3-hydroxy-5,9,17-trioxoandrosta-1(10),2-diene-4-oate hydrolase [Nocardia mexicana]